MQKRSRKRFPGMSRCGDSSRATLSVRKLTVNAMVRKGDYPRYPVPVVIFIGQSAGLISQVQSRAGSGRLATEVLGIKRDI